MSILAGNNSVFGVESLHILYIPQQGFLVVGILLEEITIELGSRRGEKNGEISQVVVQ